MVGYKAILVGHFWKVVSPGKSISFRYPNLPNRILSKKGKWVEVGWYNFEKSPPPLLLCLGFLAMCSLSRGEAQCWREHMLSHCEVLLQLARNWLPTDRSFLLNYLLLVLGYIMGLGNFVGISPLADLYPIKAIPWSEEVLCGRP